MMQEAETLQKRTEDIFEERAAEIIEGLNSGQYRT